MYVTKGHAGQRVTKVIIDKVVYVKTWHHKKYRLIRYDTHFFVCLLLSSSLNTKTADSIVIRMNFAN